MDRTTVNNSYVERVMANLDEYRSDMKEIVYKLKNSRALYKGKPIPFLYVPKLYSKEDLEQFRDTVSMMMQICEKMIRLYKSTPLVRAKYGFSKRLEKLILKENPYASLVPMARFDVFYNGVGDYKFCELNTDGTSAMNEEDVLRDIFLESHIFRQMNVDYDLNSFELFDSWVKEVRSIYIESKGVQENPVVAIVDLMEKSYSVEFTEFKERFIKAGMPCVIADARDLRYDNGLYYKDQRIDIVYRRLVTKDMIERIDELEAFEKACLDDQTLVIGNIQSQVVHNKLFFKLLFDQDIREYFDMYELEFIDKHVPFTDEIASVSQRMDEIVLNKDSYLIKPLDYYASIGVYAGKDYSEEEWKQILIDNLDKPYLIQEFCSPPKSINIDPTVEIPSIAEYNNITGLFVYNTKLYGMYSRLGRTSIISGLHDVFTLPTFVYKFKS